MALQRTKREGKRYKSGGRFQWAMLLTYLAVHKANMQERRIDSNGQLRKPYFNMSDG